MLGMPISEWRMLARCVGIAGTIFLLIVLWVVSRVFKKIKIITGKSVINWSLFR